MINVDVNEPGCNFLSLKIDIFVLFPKLRVAIMLTGRESINYVKKRPDLYLKHIYIYFV